MAAFDRIRSGIPEMDAALDNIRLGDNVVFRVQDLEEFRAFVRPYVLQAVRDHRHMVYIRFAEHLPLIPLEKCDELGIKVEHVALSHRFETFTVDVHRIIERHGRDAFYVFDCLSELGTAWATDLMMGNFFRVTCPYLFKLDTVAYFPLIRGRHSLTAIAKIQNTAQVFLDVYPDPVTGDVLYVRPEKVWNRNLPTMLYPHSFDLAKRTFRPITDGVGTSHFYRAYELCQRSGEDQDTDSWDRFFHETKQRARDGLDVTEACSRMCNIMMSRDEHMRQLIRDNFGLEDYLRIRNRMVGTGMIGGKACGMLTARQILKNHAPEVYAKLEPHDSFYVGSDVFYSYIVDNDFWDLRVEQRTPEGYFSLAGEFADRLMHGRFSHSVEAKFRFMLDSYGRDPYIVRSSSILEDGFGNAFAGKYESVFCSNSGTMEERLAEFENAARTVYASTMSMSALDYRKRRGLEKRDEQMALLVQRVSGSHYGKYFMPCAAGVGYSVSPYRFHADLDPKAGMLRLVMGLGTSAVDRTEGSYPRIVSLDQPELTAAVTSAEKHQFSQRKLELVDQEERQVVQVQPDAVLPLLPEYVKDALLEHDFDAERQFRERGQNRRVIFISCLGLVKNHSLMASFRRMLATIQGAYHYPVDTEFTVNISPDGDYVINLLQCRPLQALHDTEAGGCNSMPASVPEDDVLLECRSASMGTSMAERIDAVVWVDPEGYYHLPYARKPDIARLIGQINRKLADTSLRVVLMVPGRVGTSSPELGVPTTFADISSFTAICEIAESRIGYNPELSYGSHIFQDLVESGILYTAVFEGKSTIAFHPQMILSAPNALPAIVEDAGGYTGLIHVTGTSEEFRKAFPNACCTDSSLMLWHDMPGERLLIAKS